MYIVHCIWTCDISHCVHPVTYAEVHISISTIATKSQCLHSVGYSLQHVVWNASFSINGTFSLSFNSDLLVLHSSAHFILYHMVLQLCVRVNRAASHRLHYVWRHNVWANCEASQSWPGRYCLLAVPGVRSAYCQITPTCHVILWPAPLHWGLF